MRIGTLRRGRAQESGPGQVGTVRLDRRTKNLTKRLRPGAMAEARAGLSTQLEAFAANTMEYMKRERALLLDGVGVPDVATEFDGRHVPIVVRGYDYKEDLQALRSYIR